MRSTALTSLVIMLALLLGVLLGRILCITSLPIPPTILRKDIRPLVPVIHITGAEDGHITGVTHGGVRVLIGETVVIPNGSGAFRVPAGNILKHLTTPSLPSGMRFVASKKGKKYYPANSRSGQNLAPANRRYFTTAQEAEVAGYEAGN